jgi:hypothetical protein
MSIEQTRPFINQKSFSKELPFTVVVHPTTIGWKETHDHNMNGDWLTIPKNRRWLFLFKLFIKLCQAL